MFGLFDLVTDYFQNMSVDGEPDMTKADAPSGGSEENAKKPKIKLPSKVILFYPSQLNF